MTNTMKTIDDLLYRYASQRDAYYSECEDGVISDEEWVVIRDKIQAEAKQALSTMLSEIIGEDEVSKARDDKLKQSPPYQRNQAKAEQRRRATDRGFKLKSEEKNKMSTHSTKSKESEE